MQERRRKSTAKTAAGRWCSSADASGTSWPAPAIPDCKTTRRLDQAKKIPDVPLDEKCPQCGRNLVLRHGRFGEFVSCSGYPECKWVKQNFIGMKCPQCKDGELVEKKARRGNFFYGCSNYPKCDFTSATKPVAEACPGLRQPLPAGEGNQGRHLPGLPQQQGQRAGKEQGTGKEKGGRAGSGQDMPLRAPDRRAGGEGHRLIDISDFRFLISD